VVTPRLHQLFQFVLGLTAFAGFAFFMRATLLHNGVNRMTIALLFFGFHVISFGSLLLVTRDLN
jgi:hypothetical protein